MNAVTQNVISFGRSLARRMRAIDIMAHLAGLDEKAAYGTVHVALCRSHVAGVKNVECWAEDLDPVDAVTALTVAVQRLKTIHGISDGGLHFQAVDLYDAEVMRRHAEHLVDMCRESRVACVDGNPLHTFTESRENCVRAAIVMLASASVTPTTLSHG